MHRHPLLLRRRRLLPLQRRHDLLRRRDRLHLLLTGARRSGLRLSLLLLFALIVPASATAAPWVGVKGNHLVDRSGHVVRLLGVNRSGTEYACQQGWGFFDGPRDAASIKAMKSWHINAVRVPLNETCWLGINGIDPQYGGAAYRRTIRSYVSKLERAGLYVILNLELAGPGESQATSILPMPDADHSPDFWRSVAAAYRDDRAVLFDLYTEPHDVGWGCWENGCQIEGKGVGSYRAAGMTELVEAVRSTGARQPVLVPGVDWARNLSQWLVHLPSDPARAIVASNHTYDFAACGGACRTALAQIAASHPVVSGEIGEGDCADGYIGPYMRWADRHGISYLAWAWDAGGGWTCKGGPALISDYDGTPTPFGVGFRDHLRSLAH
jgi:endoglucanase